MDKVMRHGLYNFLLIFTLVSSLFHIFLRKYLQTGINRGYIYIYILF